jgi:hypothetical protein
VPALPPKKGDQPAEARWVMQAGWELCCCCCCAAGSGYYVLLIACLCCVHTGPSKLC